MKGGILHSIGHMVNTLTLSLIAGYKGENFGSLYTGIRKHLNESKILSKDPEVSSLCFGTFLIFSVVLWPHRNVS